MWHRRLYAHRGPHEVTKSWTRLLGRRRGKLLRQLRIVLKDIIRIHAAHLRAEEGIAHVEHEAATHQRHHKLRLWRHVSATLVLVIELLKHLVEVLDILMHRLRPAIELPVKRIKLTVKKLRACHRTHQALALKTKGCLQILGIHQAIILYLDLFECVIHGKALRKSVAL